MKKVQLFLFILAFAQTLLAGQELWVQRYSGDGGQNFATAIVVSQGNLYVTGSSDDATGHRSFVTIKYHADGSELWTRRYHGPGTGDDGPFAITADSSGNILVTGASWGDGTLLDFATIKYDPDGNELWVGRYNGPANSLDYAFAITVDTDDNVYVTGRSDSPPETVDYATVKYDSNGNQLWVARYNNGGLRGSHVPHAIIVDFDKNVYVTGQSWGGATGTDFATIKYDIDGNQQWVARYNGSRNNEDYGYVIGLDGQGNVYVAGKSTGVSRTWNYALVKYDSEGNQLWVAEDSRPSDDSRLDMALDPDGNIYVTGGSLDVATSSQEYVTIKFQPDGSQLWLARYSGPGPGGNSATAIVIDSAGNAYVTGQSSGQGTYLDYLTIKYDPDGNQLWVRRYDGPGHGQDTPYAIALDPGGGVYVTGTSFGTLGKFEYATVKYSQQ